MSVYQAPMVMRLRPSRIGRACLVAAALLAIAAIALADITTHLQLGAVLLVGALALHAWRAPRPLELKLNPDGRLQWRAAASPWQETSLLPSSTVTPWLCLLACRLEGERRVRHVALYPDSLPADDFRRLRVWLRWRALVEGAVPAGDASPPS